MRRPRPGEGTATEKRAAQVGTATARPSDDRERRTLERPQRAVEDACLDKHGESSLLAVDVELVARTTVERVPRIRPDLGMDAEVAKERESTTRNPGGRDVEMQGNTVSAQEVDRPGGMEERGKLRQAIAATEGSDCRQFGSHVGRERHQSVTPSRASRRRFSPTPAAP